LRVHTQVTGGHRIRVPLVAQHGLGDVVADALDRRVHAALVHHLSGRVDCDLQHRRRVGHERPASVSDVHHPDSCSNASAWRTVRRFTPNSAARADSVGIRAPGSHSPELIRS
jgi:hypothetical protein